MKKYQNKYRILSARAGWHDYNGGFYFITICTAGHENYFGQIDSAVMQLNELGQFVEDNILNLNNHYPYVEIPLHVVMPNHIHLIVFVNGDGLHGTHETNDSIGTHVETGRAPSLQEMDKQPINEKMQLISLRKGLLSVAMGGLKSATTKFAHLNKIQFGWQTRFHDHIIRNQEECNRIALYIENNPSKWESDKFHKMINQPTPRL